MKVRLGGLMRKYFCFKAKSYLMFFISVNLIFLSSVETSCASISKKQQRGNDEIIAITIYCFLLRVARYAPF